MDKGSPDNPRGSPDNPSRLEAASKLDKGLPDNPSRLEAASKHTWVRQGFAGQPFTT